MDFGFRKVKIEMSSISDYVSNLAFFSDKKCVLYLFYFLGDKITYHSRLGLIEETSPQPSP
jgi:hypothetical protein